MSYWKFVFIIILLATSILDGLSQNDSIVFANNNYIVGEIKDLGLGVLKVETDYSDADFTMNWDQIKYLKSAQIFLINTSGGDRYNGSIETVPGDPSKILIHDLDDGDLTAEMINIVSFKTVDQTFISRLSLLLSAGYTLTKANNNHQLSGRVDLGYLSNTFGFGTYFNLVRTTQEEDSIKLSTKRTEAGANLNFFVYKDWILLVASDLLQSTELGLDLRAVTKGGVGNYLVNNQQMYLMIAGGAAWNYEDYTIPDTTTTNPLNSAEGFLGIKYNIFDIGDLDLTTSLYGYPSLTQKGRFRTDFIFDIRYEFAFDLSFGVGFTLNYDSKPPVTGASKSDYVLQTTIGWEL